MSMETDDRSGGLNSAAVVGLVLGLIIVLLLITISGTVIVFLIRKKQGQRVRNEELSRKVNWCTDGELLAYYIIHVYIHTSISR